MSGPEAPPPGSGRPPGSESTPRSLREWQQLWTADAPVVLPPRTGLSGRLKDLVKRVLRPVVRAPQADLWERQRRFNLALYEELQVLRSGRDQAVEKLNRIQVELDRLGADLQQVQNELVRDLVTTKDALSADLRSVQDALEGDLAGLRDTHLSYLQGQESRVAHLEAYRAEGIQQLGEQLEGLMAAVDQKLDRYRREVEDQKLRLKSLLEAAASADGAVALKTASNEQSYIEFERSFRGTEEEIAERLAHYPGYLRDRGPVLDLGCGRGEALAVFEAAGIPCRGIDSSGRMVEICREKGLEAKRAELFEELASIEPESLGGIVSFHVIEHLPATSLDRLARLAWSALRPGGVLILETPNPLSLVAAGNFWLDPTHQRPVHPRALRQLLKDAGFEQTELLYRQPFDDKDRLPQIDLEGLPEEQWPLAVSVNRIRDHLDELLHGFQDFAVIGFKPRRP